MTTTEKTHILFMHKKTTSPSCKKPLPIVFFRWEGFGSKVLEIHWNAHYVVAFGGVRIQIIALLNYNYFLWLRHFERVNLSTIHITNSFVVFRQRVYLAVSPRGTVTDSTFGMDIEYADVDVRGVSFIICGTRPIYPHKKRQPLWLPFFVISI